MINYIKSEDNLPIVKISMDKFKFNRGKFCMSFDFDIDPLRNSIKKVGVINKPKIISYDGGDIEIVAGYRRILALKELKINEVSCFNLSNSGKTDFDMLLMNIHDNLHTRKLNNIEKSMVLNRLINYSKDKQIGKEFISLFAINERELETLLKIDTLPEGLKYSIVRNSISLKALENIFSIDNEKERITCLEWINKLKLNFNQQLQFIEYINDISRLNKTTIHRVLLDNDFKEMYDDKKKNTPQKARKLLHTLREKLFPNLTGYERIFARRVNKLQLPGNIKISHPRYFEAEGYKLEIEFKNNHDLKDSIDYLGKVKGLENIGDPWEKDQLK
ncbi:ParB/RepB/Spo0J family partition protein [Thermodesulfobacteriota bacterium]